MLGLIILWTPVSIYFEVVLAERKFTMVAFER